MDKKKAGKPNPVQIIMERTFGSAIAVVALIDQIPWEKLTFEMYYICNDIEFKRFIRLFDTTGISSTGSREVYIRTS